jgi:hypothetical protein
MQSADVGIVLVDAAGTIVGGGTTFVSGPIAHGARQFFSASFIFNTVPAANAASALVSAVPTYPLTP